MSGDPSINRAQARVENLPADDGRAFDTLAGGMLRVFARLNQIEAPYGDLRKRVAILEERPAIRGSSAASRFAHRQARSAADTATDLLGHGS